MEIKIEKNIPIPNRERHVSKYPFGKMKVGDSFFLLATDTNANKIRSAAAWYAVRNGFKFTVRKEGEGVRCWRIK